MVCALLSLCLLAQAGSAESLQPQERAVKHLDATDLFAKQQRVRLVPTRVYKVKYRGVSVDGMTATCLDPSDHLNRRTIVADDFAGEDRKWFEREAAKLWKRYPTVESLLGESVRAQIIERNR